MSSKLFKNFIKKAVLSKQGPPGAPPRQGLQWKPQTHRWIRPKEQVSPEQDWNIGENTFTFNDFKENHMNDKTIQDIDNFVAEMLKQEVEDPEVGPWGIVGMHDFLGQVVEELDIVTPNMDDDTHLDKAMEWIDEQVQNAVNKHGHKEPEFKSKFDIADLPEIAFENIKTDVEMAGLPGPKHFKNAKEYAEYLSESTFQSLVDIRNDDDPDPAYFRDNVGFPDTDENIDAYADALDAQAKEYSEIPDFAKEYGTGTHIDDMEDEDYWVDFDINEHKDGIKNYLDEVWTDYNHLSPDKIQDKILMPLVEDLDIVLPNDDEGMDKARESLERYLGEAIQNKWLSSMGKTGRELGRMGESKRRKR